MQFITLKIIFDVLLVKAAAVFSHRSIRRKSFVMRQVEEVEGIRWLEVKVLNEENNWEEICIDSICVSSFPPSAV